MWQGEIWEPEFCSFNNHNDAKRLDVQSMAQLVYTTHGTSPKLIGNVMFRSQHNWYTLTWDSLQH